MESTPKADNSNTPWNSQHYCNQKLRPELGTLKKLLQGGEPLPWCRANDSIAITAIDDLTPGKLQEIKQDPQESKKRNYWNEQTLTCEGMSGWSNVYLIVAGLAKVACLFVAPIFFMVALSFSIFDNNVSLIEVIGVLIDFALYAFLPLALIWGQFELVNRGYLPPPFFLKGVRVFRLNRQTGMVTLYHKGKALFSHPFIEFDCHLVSNPSQQGIMSYSLYLVHRYQNYSKAVPLHYQMSSQFVAEYHRMWNMIQRYMDISQPLPDVLVLEEARERDPTTLAYDNSHPRELCYWRDMDDEDYAATLQQMRQDQQHQPATGPQLDIFNGGINTAAQPVKD